MANGTPSAEPVRSPRALFTDEGTAHLDRYNEKNIIEALAGITSDAPMAVRWPPARQNAIPFEYIFEIESIGLLVVDRGLRSSKDGSLLCRLP